MRHYKSGAFRNEDKGRIDPSGAQCPRCTQLFCEYIKRHRGNPPRTDDNWQKGFDPKDTVKSLRRHVLDVELWLHDEDGKYAEEEYQDALAATIFNAQSLLHEHHKQDE